MQCFEHRSRSRLFGAGNYLAVYTSLGLRHRTFAYASVLLGQPVEVIRFHSTQHQSWAIRAPVKEHRSQSFQGVHVTRLKFASEALQVPKAARVKHVHDAPEIGQM